MDSMQEVLIQPKPLEQYRRVVDESAYQRWRDTVRSLAERLAGSTVWHVNSTSQGGGVAEMLRPEVAYSRGAGIDTRWVVVSGTAPFFDVTKRIHHALHGSAGNGTPLGEAQHAVFEEVGRANAAWLLARVAPGDVVVLHDPQSAPLARPLMDAGVDVTWRCHVGTEGVNEETERGWAFLERYLADVPRAIVSRREYRIPFFAEDRVFVVPPAIDPFTPKNQAMDAGTVDGILAWADVLGCRGRVPADGPPSRRFIRESGAWGTVRRRATVVREGWGPMAGEPLVAQISRWDPLKDHMRVMQGFAEFSARSQGAGVHLLLVGPDNGSVADDPESVSTFDDLVAAWRELPYAARTRVHLVSLPMEDLDENAAIVNAIQRRADVVVQKSLREGFGLTVTEAMWKARPVLATRVGGIQDQIEHGVTGMLLDEPTDIDGFVGELERLLGDESMRARLGERARAHVLGHGLIVRDMLEVLSVAVGAPGLALLRDAA